MANFTFNIAKGRTVELYNRVDNDDPTGAELVVALIATTGLEAQSVLEDADTFTALVSGTTQFSTNTGSADKTLVGADLDAIAPDDTNNWNQIDLPDQTWTSVANDGTGAISAIVVGYDYLGTGVAGNIVPLTYHDFSITPDGSNVTAQITGFFKAT